MNIVYWYSWTSGSMIIKLAPFQELPPNRVWMTRWLPVVQMKHYFKKNITKLNRAPDASRTKSEIVNSLCCYQV